jgi:hypothetical protein
MSVELNTLYIDVAKGLLRSPDAADEMQMLEHWLDVYNTAPICGETFYRSMYKARQAFARLTGHSCEFYGMRDDPYSYYARVKEVYDVLNLVLQVVEKS